MIRYFNRNTKKLETETVYGGNFVDWAYGTATGRFFTRTFFSKRWMSLLMGAYEDSNLSVRQIAPFVKAYGINMNDFEKREYQNFNEFFIRKFNPGLRPFVGDEEVFSAGSEARYLAFENLKLTQTFSVKGIEVDLTELLKDEELGAKFLDGTFIVARLCPVDYHRFHFPVSGQITRQYRVAGALHSVNPAVFASEPKVFLENEREVTILELSLIHI